jgi:HEPN domain-containing protein
MKPPEDVKRDLVRQWIAKAEQDFGLVKYLVSEKTPYLEAVGFHSQQAAEKYLKAYLVMFQVEFPKTHDLDELLDLVSSVDSELADTLRDITELTNYGVEIRYPGHLPKMTGEDAKAAVEMAAKVREAITEALK